MKKQLITGAIVVSLALGGCQAADEGASPNNGNMDHPEYGNTGDGMTNVRNYSMQRDADHFQNRDAKDRENRTNDNQRNTNIDEINYRNHNYTNLNRNRVNDNDNENRYEVSKEAADKISKQVKEIDNVYVVTTDNNAYVAAELDTDEKDQNKNQNNEQNRFDDQLSDEVKKEISDIVKSVDKDIDNVYVSTNPDFFDLTNNYIEDVDRGEPIEGFFDQFGNMVERLFPQNK